MDAIKLIGTSHDGKLIVDVPEELNDKEIEIMIISSKEKNRDEENIGPKKRNIDQLMKNVGAAKYPDFPITKYDVYDQ
ncbi:MAG: hypothetical protein ACTHK0_14970 [Ginsengibacter sp.]